MWPCVVMEKQNVANVLAETNAGIIRFDKQPWCYPTAGSSMPHSPSFDSEGNQSTIYLFSPKTQFTELSLLTGKFWPWLAPPLHFSTTCVLHCITTASKFFGPIKHLCSSQSSVSNLSLELSLIHILRASVCPTSTSRSFTVYYPDLFIYYSKTAARLFIYSTPPVSDYRNN